MSIKPIRQHGSMQLEGDTYRNMLDDDENQELLEKNYDGEVSPKVWVPLSFIVGVCYAGGNICIAYISKYGLKTAGMQGIGGIFGNLAPLVFLSFQIRYEKAPERSDSVEHRKNPWYKWLFDIYLHRKVDEAERVIENQWESKIQYKRVFSSGLILLFCFLSYGSFFASYYCAVIGNLNTGILTSLTALRAIQTSIAFYFIFNQTMKWYEVLCVLIMTIAVSLIMISGDNSIVIKHETAQFYIILSCIFAIISGFFDVMRTAVLKYFYGGVKEVNVSALFNFVMVFMEGSFCVYFIICVYQGFEYETLDLYVGILGGCLFSLSNYLYSYVIVRGKAGVANCLIESKNIIQTGLDILIFARFPNLHQYIGLTLGCFSILLLIISSNCKPK
ncbi:unnamed protein product [Moneuplotes crassus]|uniref:Uncharacterized protein n=1 Tax=Euplotes crassus TaxID=5936 RepID=A0AAD1UR67_EUPCR|nr:unnamed protein product [Moneuplotes crassus]